MIPPPLVLRSPSVARTQEIGRALGAAMDPLPPGGLVVVLRGDLGAGKTTFVWGVLLGLGVDPRSPFASPTFTVARSYRGRVPIHHVDAYHLTRWAEYEAAGGEVLGGEGQVTCVEWGERFADALPPDRLEVTLTPLPPSPPAAPGDEVHLLALDRDVEVAATGPRAAKVLQRFVAAVETAARSEAGA